MDPVDEVKDKFWSLTRKAKTAGKSAFKSFKKAVGIPTGPISEANPRYYMVISGQGALVRKEAELSSPEVYSLKFGDVVTCAEIVGRRARIVDPVEGWVSLVTTSNEAIFELTFPPDKRTQARTMERRFEKLKQEKALQRNGESSPVSAPTVQRTSDDNVATLKSKVVFRTQSSADRDVCVPKLDLSGGFRKSAAAKASSEDLLLDFDSPQTARTTPELPSLESNNNNTGFSLL